MIEYETSYPYRRHYQAAAPVYDVRGPDATTSAELLALLTGPPETIEFERISYHPARPGEVPDLYYSNSREGIKRAPYVRS